jgi:hypothetical protein
MVASIICNVVSAKPLPASASSITSQTAVLRDPTAITGIGQFVCRAAACAAILIAAPPQARPREGEARSHRANEA